MTEPGSPRRARQSALLAGLPGRLMRAGFITVRSQARVLELGAGAVSVEICRGA